MLRTGNTYVKRPTITIQNIYNVTFDIFIKSFNKYLYKCVDIKLTYLYVPMI